MKLHIILTCDGGNGHKAAAEALKKEAEERGEAHRVINTTRERWFSGGGPNISPKYDPWFSSGLLDMGPIACNFWDWAQRTSNIELLCLLASLRKLSALSVPSFRHRTYELLKNIDTSQYSEIIFHNTQPNCLQALTFSIARYNREAKAHNQANPDVILHLKTYY